MSEHFSRLEELFHADPLLLHDIIYLTQSDDYVNLFQRIPTYLSLACLLSLFSELSRFNRNNVSQIIVIGNIDINTLAIWNFFRQMSGLCG